MTRRIRLLIVCLALIGACGLSGCVTVWQIEDALDEMLPERPGPSGEPAPDERLP